MESSPKIIFLSPLIVADSIMKSSSLSEKKLRQVVKSAIQDSDRSGNVMIFNVKEEDETRTSGSCADSDKAAVQEILSITGVETDGEVNCERVGRPEKDNCRPLKVTIGNVTVVSDILKRSKVLRDNDKFHKVFISPDRSKEERMERKKLVEELKQKRADNPNKRFYIKHNTIYSAPT